MIQQTKGQVFLPKKTYRNRRLIDVAKIVPFIALFFALMPIMWGNDGALANVSKSFVYFFGIWLGLILFQYGLTRVLGRILNDETVSAPQSDEP